MIKKFHYMLHFGTELRRFGFLMSCFVHERKHRMVRAFCNDVKNTMIFERTCMGNVVSQHLYKLANSSFHVGVGLVHPSCAPRALCDVVRKDLGLPNDSAVQVANVARFNEWATCKVGNVVLVRDGVGHVAGLVWKHVAVLGHTFSLMQLSRHVEDEINAGYTSWSLYSKPVWSKTSDIIAVTTWKYETNDVVHTLIPRHLRL